ncbi:MAG TPA: hypothetical protein VHG09_11980 [Longimicrobiales bacterium]|nr:hypothetical protein [Longimicrobiales bacterium]
MMRTEAMKRSGRLLRTGGLLAVLVATSGCADPLSPERDFLIRTPARRTTAAVPVVYQPSPSSTAPLAFEWSPAEGADSYTITFWQGEDEAEVERLEADFSSPLITFDVTSPTITEVPVNPENPDDPRRVRIVRHEVPLSDVAAALQQAGIQPDAGRTYTLLSVFAKNGGDEWRSSSLTPVIFELKP